MTVLIEPQRWSLTPHYIVVKWFPNVKWASVYLVAYIDTGLIDLCRASDGEAGGPASPRSGQKRGLSECAFGGRPCEFLR
ncbi:MAG: hypothetical protein WBH01_08885 [Dehalococcoidia bacterium]